MLPVPACSVALGGLEGPSAGPDEAARVNHMPTRMKAEHTVVHAMLAKLKSADPQIYELELGSCAGRLPPMHSKIFPDRKLTLFAVISTGGMSPLSLLTVRSSCEALQVKQTDNTHKDFINNVILTRHSTENLNLGFP
jgi:hypothetical protein